jgi:hypothetical protein
MPRRRTSLCQALRPHSVRSRALGHTPNHGTTKQDTDLLQISWRSRRRSSPPLILPIFAAKGLCLVLFYASKTTVIQVFVL